MRCGWKYAGDLSLVAYFNLQIFLDDKEVANALVQNNTIQAAFTFSSYNQSANYKAVVSAIDYCNTQSPSQVLVIQGKNSTKGTTLGALGSLIFTVKNASSYDNIDQYAHAWIGLGP